MSEAAEFPIARYLKFCLEDVDSFLIRRKTSAHLTHNVTKRLTTEDFHDVCIGRIRSLLSFSLSQLVALLV